MKISNNERKPRSGISWKEKHRQLELELAKRDERINMLEEQATTDPTNRTLKQRIDSEKRDVKVLKEKIEEPKEDISNPEELEIEEEPEENPKVEDVNQQKEPKYECPKCSFQFDELGDGNTCPECHT